MDAQRDHTTIRAVAARAGVSRQTVSNAVNSPERLSAGTLARVREAIEELDYRPDAAALALTSRRSRLIGIRIGHSAQRHPSAPEELLREFVRAAARYDYRFVIFGSSPTDADQIRGYGEIWRRRAVDGFIISDGHARDARPRWLHDHKVPFAVFGRPRDGAGDDHPWIDVDARAGMRLVVDHLVARGRTRIAFLGWAPDAAGGDDRAAGWAEAMASHGLDADVTVRTADDSVRAADARVEALLRDSRPHAVVCASDRLAAGVVRAGSRLGLSIGDDVLVTGYDDAPAATTTIPELTTLREPFDRVADFLVDHVVHAAGIANEAPPRTRVVEPQLVVRESTIGTRA